MRKKRARAVTNAGALARMISGDLPGRNGSETYPGTFSDGALLSHKVERELCREGLIRRPPNSCFGSQWTLARRAER